MTPVGQSADQAKPAPRIGVNCSVGPAQMLDTVEVAQALPGGLFSAMPNAGYPLRRRPADYPQPEYSPSTRPS